MLTPYLFIDLLRLTLKELNNGWTKSWILNIRKLQVTQIFRTSFEKRSSGSEAVNLACKASTKNNIAQRFPMSICSTYSINST